MLREHLIRSHPARAGDFRWRGDGVSRIEGLSDAVFGFAITLLVVSLEVPRTFDALVVMLAGFPAFAAMFALLVLIWAAQYRFFRHYGLEDGTTIVLNVLLLFVVVFFIYPLKFLFQTFIGLWMGLLGAVADLPVLSEQGRQAYEALRPTQWPALMAVFAAGYVAVFGLLWLLHRHALRRADALDLDAVERLHTHSAIREHREHALVGLASIVVTVVLAYGVHLPPALSATLGGFVYFVEWPANYLRYRAFDRERRALVAAAAPGGPGVPSVPSAALAPP
ncbi:MAG TPA: TMEM175 family protein [Gemmatirosa sp.]|nr:TMEM175 family protein [Gemmatirosa sp.]